MSDQNNEIDQLTAARGGNTSAFCAIVEKYQGLVCAITYSITGDIGKSEELAQDSFIKAWQNLGQLRELAIFKNWLATIARNTAHQYIKNCKRDVLCGAAPAEAAEKAACVYYEPSKDLISREEEAIMKDALDKLPEEYRETLILYFREHRSTSEVAQLLGISESAVRVRVHRGKEMLREQVASMVETNLEKSQPGKSFAAAVMAAIGGLALTSTAASAAEAASELSSSATGTGAVSGGTGISSGTLGTVLMTAAAIIVVGGAALVGYNYMGSDEQQPQPVVDVMQVSGNGQASPEEQQAAITPIQEAAKEEPINGLAGFDPDTQVKVAINVLDVNENPVAGAEITMFRATVGRPFYKLDEERELATGADGNAVFVCPKFKRSKSVVGRTVGFMLIEKRGMACGWGRWEPSQSQNITMKLEKPALVSGKVVDENDRPVVNATVMLKGVMPAIGDDDSGYILAEKPIVAFAAMTDNEGAFVFSMPEGAKFGVEAEKPGLATSILFSDTSSKVQEAFVSPVGGIKLTMVPESIIEGTVIDKITRKPVAGVLVKADSDKYRKWLRNSELTTDDQGRFKLGGLKKGTYSVMTSRTVRKTSTVISEPVEVVLEQGQTKGITIEAVSGGMVEIQVLDSKGLPVERGYVAITPKDGGEYQLSPATDGNGVARWVSEPGTFTAQYSNASREFQIEAGKVNKVQLVVEAGSIAKGIVKGPDGTPAAKVQLALMPWRYTAVSDANGIFEITYNRNGWNGAMMLIARDSAKNLAAGAIVVDANRIELTLRPGVAVSGKVTDVNGAPLGGVTTVSIVDDTMRLYSNLEEAFKSGELKIKALPAGYEQVITIAANGYGSARQVIGKDLAVNNVELDTIILKRAQRIIEGTVVDQNDKPVSGVNIYAFGEGQPVQKLQITSDSSGHFSFNACEGVVQINASKGMLRGRGTVPQEDNEIKLKLADNTPQKYEPLLGKALPELRNYFEGPADLQLEGKKLLIVFADMDAIQDDVNLGIAETTQIEQLKAAGVELIGVQMGKSDMKAIEEQLRTAGMPIRIAYLKPGSDGIRARYGVNQLPWMVLADSSHVVRFEGLDTSEFLIVLGSLK